MIPAATSTVEETDGRWRTFAVSTPVAVAWQAHRRRLKQGHPRESRSREMEWPAFVRCNGESDTTSERYRVRLWWSNTGYLADSGRRRAPRR